MSTINVLRYAALATGITYGFFEAKSIKNAHHRAEELKEYNEKVKLINEAKAKFAALNKKPETASSEINLDDKDLDFAKVILSAVEKLQ